MASPASSSDRQADALTPKEEVAAVHTHIQLVAPPVVWYDNPVTKERERWENGMLVHSQTIKNGTWNTKPNPWQSDEDASGDLTGKILPF